MTPAVTTIGTACDLAGLVHKLQCQQQGINAAVRERSRRPAFFGRDESARLDHADAQNRNALRVVTRTLAMFPAAND